MSKLKQKIFNLRIKKQSTLKNKRGAELVESMLMIGVAIALIVVVFYPQIMALMNTTFTGLESWFTNALSQIGQPIV